MKLFVIDLEGTLLNPNFKISKENLNALSMVHKSGHLIVIATGRMPNATELVIAEFSHLISYIICYNGALVIDNRNKKIIFSKQVELSNISNIHNFLEKENYNIVFLNFNDLVTIQKKLDLLLFNYSNRVKSEVSFKELETLRKNNFSFHKAFIYNPLNIETYSYNKLNYDTFIYDSVVNLDNKFINPKVTKHGYMEFTANEISKAYGVKRLLKYLKKDFDLVLFGDAPNDIELMQMDGISICMSNGWDNLNIYSNFVMDNSKYTAVSKGIMKILRKDN